MKKILLIDADVAFARPLSDALAAHDYGVIHTVDGQEGVELARLEPPDAIVLAAELQGTSGYAICNRIKKDEALRAIPLVVTSAAGTLETFEQHRKLRTRAEDYLLKPFAAEALLEKLGALVGLPVDAAARAAALGDDDEIEATLAALDEAARSPEPAPPPGPGAGAPAALAPRVPEPDAVLRAFDEAPAPADDREQEVLRLQDRISELRVEAARVAEERERLVSELAAAVRERDAARARVAELEGVVEQHDRRIVKAYERLKSDAVVKEKTRKALAIALQLLEDGAA